MEARDALTGEYDVIVSEGFSGNVLLKTVEGTGLLAGTLLRAIHDPAVDEAARALTNELNFSLRGASMFLGLKSRCSRHTAAPRRRPSRTPCAACSASCKRTLFHARKRHSTLDISRASRYNIAERTYRSFFGVPDASG